MTTHLRFNLIRKPQAIIPILFFLALVWLPFRTPTARGQASTTPAQRRARAQTPPSTPPPTPPPTTTQGDCGTTFAGTWHTQQNSDDSWQIAVNGEAAEGSYSLTNKQPRMLKGNIDDNQFEGEWQEQQGQQSGNFTATLYPSSKRISITFYSKGYQVDSMVWLCELTGGTGGTTTLPRKPTTVPGDHDLDNFATFDSLTKSQQEAVLTKKGPRLRKEYDANDFSMRVFVKGGWPMVLEYGLDSDQPAQFTLSAEGRDVRLRLEPGDQQVVNITLPDYFGSEPQVGKLHITARTGNDYPADFHLYGLAFGDRGVGALRKVDRKVDEVQLARNKATRGLESGYEPLALFRSAPQTSTAIQISARLPATLKAKQNPKNIIEFSCTSRADFSEGRWEWWRVTGLHWDKVWQKGMKGAISRNQTKSESWDGLVTIFKLVSLGSHALHVTAWQKAGSDRDSVVAQLGPRLLVIE